VTKRPSLPAIDSTITGDTPSRLVAAAFVDDPTLPVITTPNGAVSFVQVFGITADELDAVCNGDLMERSRQESCHIRTRLLLRVDSIAHATWPRSRRFDSASTPYAVDGRTP
jgi:hypothetical protein